MTALVLKCEKKWKVMLKQHITRFTPTQKSEILMMYLNHCITDITNIQKSLGTGSGWIIDSA